MTASLARADSAQLCARRRVEVAGDRNDFERKLI